MCMSLILFNELLVLWRQDGEAFTKTSCYHYFHSHCLGRYIRHSEMELREREKEIEEDKSRGMMEGEVRGSNLNRNR